MAAANPMLALHDVLLAQHIEIKHTKTLTFHCKILIGKVLHRKPEMFVQR